MQRMQSVLRSRAIAALASPVLLLACPAAAEMGDFTKGLQEGALPLAEAVLILGCALALASVLVLIAALLELTGKVHLLARCCGGLSYSIAHLVLATLWLPVVGISIFLITKTHYPAVAFVATGAVFIAAHTALAVRQLCWCCCSWRFNGPSTENPKSALLPNSQSGEAGRQGRADSPTGVDAGGGGCEQFNPVAGVHGVGGVSAGGSGALESRNPFHASYGLIPGSSVFAYQIFIPGSEEQQQAGGRWGPPTGGSRHGSPGSEGRQQARTSIQPLVQLQSARSRQ